MMLGVAGAVGEFMVLLGEAAAESALMIAGRAAIGVGVAAGAYALAKRVKKKRQGTR